MYQEWARDRRNERRRELHHEKVGKFIEKQSDRDTLKGKSFTKCFEKCFLEASERFRFCLREEARSIVKEAENYNDVCDKTLDSVFDCDLWKKAAESYLSQNCEYINGLRKDPNDIYDCQSKPEVPCLCHCSDSVLYDVIEAGMNRAFEDALERNITSISKSIAFKAWDKSPYGFERKMFGSFKENLYKKTFAKFYHEESFLHAYEEAYNHSIESLKKDVDKNCEKNFDWKLFNSITDEPNVRCI